jgi:UDP:flavonoid glycosyltransferase YjiC (YdhE family)
MRILFTFVPAYGHLHPMLPLARAFANDGHEVAFATGPDFVDRVAAAGFAGFACGTPVDAWFGELTRRVGGPPGEGVPAGEIMLYWLPRLFAEVGAPFTAEDLIPLAASWRPRLIVHESYEFAGPLAAAVIGVPSVQHSLSPLSSLEVMTAAGDAVAPLWDRWNQEPQPQGGAYATVCLCLSPPSLETPGACPPEKMRPLRSVPADAKPGDELPAWMSELPDRPSVHATLGTSATNQDQGVLRTIIAGLANDDVNVIVTVGQNNDPEALGPLPGNAHVERYISHSLLLPRCDAIIAHGGAGTMFGAIQHGLPQLLIPQGADQYINAQRCVDGGCARQLLPDEVTADAVRREVRTLLEDHRYRDGAQRVRAEMEAMPSPEVVARSLLQELALR